MNACVHRAAWVLPISRPPIRDGWVAVDRGVIVAVGGPSDEPPPASARPHRARDEAAPTPRVALLPGLVNAHTHLELSWLRGRIPRQTSMPDWVRRVLALRRTVASDPEQPIVDAIAEARAAGTCLVGEVTNTLASYDALADSELSAAIFRELIGFTVEDGDRLVAETAAQIDALTPIAWLRPTIVPHAPYSVSAALLRAIANARADAPVSVHAGESRQEIEFLQDGTGMWRDLLEELGAWKAGWQPPRCGPVEYLDGCGLVAERLLAVHGVQFTDRELARLAEADATLVTCPRSNEWTGAGAPPVGRFYASGVRVAIGTDSLASVEDLNVFNELAAVRRLAPDVPASRLLESATRHGADALGFGAELGTLEPGKRAELIAVSLPGAVEDVEEYLLGGIQPEAIRWLEPWNAES